MRLVTLNLRLDLDRWPERLPLVVEALAAADADVIGLQEVALPIRQDHLIADLLNERTPDRPYAVLTAPKWGAEPEAVSALVRPRVLDHEVRELPVGGRVALRVEVELDGGPLHVVVTHLHHWPLDDETVRAAQMRTLLGWLREREVDDPCVLMGDLNSTPGTVTLRAAGELFGSALAPGLATFPTPLSPYRYPPVQIDHVLYSRSLRVLDAGPVAHRGHPADAALYPSDHIGIFAVVARADAQD